MRHHRFPAACGLLLLLLPAVQGQTDTKFLGKSAPEWARQLKADRDPLQRRNAAFDLGKMGNRAGEVLLEIKTCLSNEKEARVREAIVFALGEIARESLTAGGDSDLEETLCRLVRAESEAPLVRRSAAVALGCLNAKSPRVLEALSAALSDSEPAVKQNAAWALGRFGTDALPALRKALRDSDPLVQRDAAGALLQVPDGDKVHELVPELLPLCEASNSEVCRAGLEVLVRVVDKDDKQALPILRKLLENRDLGIKRTAALTMSNIGGKDAAPALPVLLAALRTGDIEVRRLATVGLGKLGEAGAPAVPDLLKLVRSDSDLDVRVYAAGALGSIGEANDEVVKMLVDRVRDKEDPPKLRAAAATAINWLGAKAPERTRGAITQLVVILQDPAEDVDVRTRVIWALRPNIPALPDIPGVFEVLSSVAKEPKTGVNAMVRYDSAYTLSLGWREKVPDAALDVLSEFLRDSSFIIFDRNATRVGSTGGEVAPGRAVSEERGSGDARVMATQALTALGARRWSGRLDIVQQLRTLAADTKIFPDLRRQAQELVKMVP